MKGMRTFRGIPRSVLVLGFVSLFMDVSSEMIHSLLPVFLVVGLGASALSLGVIEGIAESTALITKVFSGFLSDRLGKRKVLAVMGYAIGTLTKPLFAVAGGVGLVLTARFLDRIGKGIRGAPRDALIADITSAEIRGAAFGLRQSMDTAGAFIGPTIASLLMIATSNSFRTVFWVAVLPGILAVSLLALGVEEPEHKQGERKGKPIQLADVKMFRGAYWFVVAFGSIFTLARFSEAFILLRAQGVGVQASLVPFFMVLMNVVYTLCAYPVGVLSDKLGRMGMLSAGCLVLVASDAVFALASGYALVALGAALWGLHMGLTQGIFSTLVADTSPAEIRGSAFGIFSLATGIAMLIASVLAGWLWDVIGPPATFWAGAAFALVGYVGLVLRGRHIPSLPD
jgi:MFS family permease